ncbi:hypothetical protein GCM10028806_33500 [Spirosoma terrae]|uniref:Uncharacterized protein n=1 Tax=Spirosoma terrae TaxID=1968276 RepID=A0A6L9L4W8_9BACT|nr:hypothetical protein [Spirosoma terrae]NDU95665.1 hypothetical protein [Spirosoma terrae]
MSGNLFGNTPSIANRTTKIFDILLEYYQLEGNGAEDASRDLLSDLMHYMAENQLNFADMWRTALNHFEFERGEENLPGYPFLDTNSADEHTT